MSAVGAPATVPTGDKIGAAAKALSDASYPFLKEVQDCKPLLEIIEKLHLVSWGWQWVPLTEHADLFV